MDPLRLRMARLISRIVRWAAIVTAGSDENPHQTQEVSFLGFNVNSQAWYPYGFNALAPEGSLSLMLAVGGDTGAAVHLPGSPKERIKVGRGEVVVFNPDTKAKVHFRANGDIDIEAPSDLNVSTSGDVNVEAAAQISLEAPIAVHTSSTIAVHDTPIFTVTGALDHDGTTAGFFGATPALKPVVTGSNLADRATSLRLALETLGLIKDSTT